MAKGDAHIPKNPEGDNGQGSHVAGNAESMSRDNQGPGVQMNPRDAQSALSHVPHLEISGSHAQAVEKRESKPSNEWDQNDKASLKDKLADSTVDQLQKAGFPKDGVPALAASGLKGEQVTEMLKAGVPVDQIRNLADAGASGRELGKSNDPTLRALGARDVNDTAASMAAAYGDKSPAGIQKLMPQVAADAARAQAMIASIESRLKTLTAQV